MQITNRKMTINSIQKALIIAESPLQIICAFEALHTFSIKKTKFIIRLADNGRNNPQILDLLKVLSIKEEIIKYVKINPQSRTVKGTIISLILVLRVSIFSLLGYKIFIGYYNSKWAKLLTILVPNRNKVYLDDGTASLMYSSKLLNSGSTFFSFFRFNTPYYIPNSFESIKRLLQETNQTNRKECLLFIGTAIREVKFCTLEKYTTILQNCLKKNHDIEFCYIAHRRELEEDLDMYRSMGINVLNNNLPIEMFEYEFPHYSIKKIYSLSSSAMFTLQKIYSPEIYFYDNSKAQTTNTENYGRILKEAENIGYKIEI